MQCNGTIICFINCHLAAFNPAYRVKQFRRLERKLGSRLGIPGIGLGLVGQFHQTVWLGDLNYRIAGLTGEQVLAQLADPVSVRRCFAEHDSLRRDQAGGLTFHGFVEPRMAADFYPTYKKFRNRPPTDYSSRDWPEQTYQVAYKEPFYKGAQVRERVPGWCDRVLWLPNDDYSAFVPLPAQKGQSPLVRPKLFKALQQVTNEYRALNDGQVLTASDHSPVYAGFELQSKRNGPAGNTTPNGNQTYMTITLGEIRLEGANAEDVERCGDVADVQVVFPGPYEDANAFRVTQPSVSSGDDGSLRHRCEHRFIHGEEIGNSVCCKFTWQTSQPYERFHMLLQVKFAAGNDEKPLNAQASFALRTVQRGVLTSVRAPLFLDGLPVTPELLAPSPTSNAETGSVTASPLRKQSGGRSQKTGIHLTLSVRVSTVSAPLR